MDQKPLLTTAEVADLLGVQKDTVGEWVRRGVIPAKYVSRLPCGRGRYRIASEWVVTLSTFKPAARFDIQERGKRDLDFVLRETSRGRRKVKSI